MNLRRRLAPLYVSVFLQGVLLWIPVEKLFQTEIGFDAADIGVMAAASAALVPLLQLPSGILADRWSRRGVLILGSLALAVSSAIGALSHSVLTYIVGAMVLGLYFALYNGTMDSVLYDTILEETGSGADFERRVGRVRTIEAVALVASSLLGGWLAGLLSPRATYWLTVPFALASVGAYLAFREPRLHKASEPVALRRQVRDTVTALTQRRRLLPVAALGVLTAVILQLVFEFGPLWLVALAVPAAVYGPYWAAMVSTIGVSGLLAGRLRLERPATAWAVATALTAAAAVLTVGAGALLVTAAQVTMALLLGFAEIRISALLHDGVPSAIRTGVAAGVSSLAGLVFLPVALAFGLVSSAHGVRSAGWLLVVAAALAGGLIVAIAYRSGAEETRPGAAGGAVCAAVS
ncbi:MAG TPA: MFS transporter [Mycobacteriales bacterium]|nr:MFS transporter [Mycobacteriales bacterium]